MAIHKDKKKEIIEKLGDMFTKTASVVFVHFHGLLHGEESALRTTLNEEGIRYYVAKKTLIKKVVNEKGYAGATPDLPGELALVYRKDLSVSSNQDVAPARSIHAFVKRYKERLSIVGGVFDGKFLNAEEMTEIATIPPLDVLRGQFVMLINSPLQGLVVALNEVAEQKK